MLKIQDLFTSVQNTSSVMIDSILCYIRLSCRLNFKIHYTWTSSDTVSRDYTCRVFNVVFHVCCLFRGKPLCSFPSSVSYFLMIQSYSLFWQLVTDYQSISISAVSRLESVFYSRRVSPNMDIPGNLDMSDHFLEVLTAEKSGNFLRIFRNNRKNQGISSRTLFSSQILLVCTYKIHEIGFHICFLKLILSSIFPINLKNLIT